MDPTKKKDKDIEEYKPQPNINESKAEKPDFGKDSISNSQTGIISSKVRNMVYEIKETI